MHRRSLLSWLATGPALASTLTAATATATAATISATTPAPSQASADGLRFPADFGAHPAARTEWWYVTGSLQADARLWGFQMTFFRVTTGIGDGSKLATATATATTATPTPAATSGPGTPAASRFAASQLLFAHAALTDLAQKKLRHDQRIARAGFGIARARDDDTDIALRDWSMRRESPPPGSAAASRYRTRVLSDSAGFALDLAFDTTQPVLLQGDAGLSKKGPGPDDTSRYYSEPQLAVSGQLVLDGRPAAVTGRAWLDHEWSDAFLPAQAVGWDWIGMNLDDGAALTAFRLRRSDGSAVYAGGSLRPAGQAQARNFASAEVRFEPRRVWVSSASRARYPVQWRVETPAGRFDVQALLDDQELDSRASTGAIYWEGLSDLLDAASGRRVGRGYLEMTGYAGTLRI